MVLSLFWVVTLTPPLIALMLSAGCSALPRPVSEARFVATTPNATAAELPADGSGQYWKREQSREIKLGPAWIVQIIERAGPLDEELQEAAASPSPSLTSRLSTCCSRTRLAIRR